MSEKKQAHDWVKLFQIMDFLHFSHPKPTHNLKKRAGDDIKNRVLLKIERAEIMAAMIAMREGK